MGDRLVGLRSDLEGWRGARVEVGVDPSSLDLDAHYVATVLEEGAEDGCDGRQASTAFREARWKPHGWMGKWRS